MMRIDLVSRVLRSERGVTAAEYAVLATGVVLTVSTAAIAFSAKVLELLGSVIPYILGTAVAL